MAAPDGLLVRIRPIRLMLLAYILEVQFYIHPILTFDIPRSPSAA